MGVAALLQNRTALVGKMLFEKSAPLSAVCVCASRSGNGRGRRCRRRARRIGMLRSRLQFHEDKSLAKQESKEERETHPRPRIRIGSREEGRGDKEEGSDVGKEEDSIHESFLRPPESTLRPIYLRTIERKEAGQTDGAQTRKKESQTLTRATKSVGGGRSCNNARWLRVDDIGNEQSLVDTQKQLLLQE